MPTYPTSSLTRVSGVIHRFNAREGVYQIEAFLGGTSVALQLKSEAVARRATAEAQYQQDVVDVADKAATAAVESVGGATLTEMAKGVLKRAGLYYQRKATRQPLSTAPLTSRVFQVQEEQEQGLQRLEEQVALRKGEAALTARSKRVISESPGAQTKLAEINKKKWTFWDWFKLVK